MQLLVLQSPAQLLQREQNQRRPIPEEGTAGQAERPIPEKGTEETKGPYLRRPIPEEGTANGSSQQWQCHVYFLLICLDGKLLPLLLLRPWILGFGSRLLL